MSLQVEKLEKNMAKLTIEVDASELEKAIEGAYQKNKKHISIPGFRKGKVPRQMIERMYGREVFYEDAVNDLLPRAYEKALEECTEDIVSSPKIEVTQVKAGEPFIFTAEVALKPEVRLGKYKGVKVDKLQTEVTEEEVNAEIDKERERNARTITVEDRPVRDGDMVTLDFEGFVDGTAFEGGRAEDYSLTIGSGAFIPGFEEQLVGAEIGKETEVQVTFPENYNSEELKGRAAVFKCTIKDIKVKELPDADDEFASEVSEFETLEEYKQDIRKNLTERKEKDAGNARQDAVIEAIIADADMEIPEAMLETQQRQMADDFARRIRMQGLTIDQYFQFTGSNYEMLLEQVKPQADKKIKSRLVLEAVAAAEGIRATEEDYEKEVEKMAEIYQMEADKVREMLGDREKKNIMEDLAIQKAVSFVVENAEEK
ncbi:MAG: trigger factor [Lachnospiraceae bacterium]|nr:trigger factor [Lachnospiraceae bacterium]